MVIVNTTATKRKSNYCKGKGSFMNINLSMSTFVITIMISSTTFANTDFHTSVRYGTTSNVMLNKQNQVSDGFYDINVTFKYKKKDNLIKLTGESRTYQKTSSQDSQEIGIEYNKTLDSGASTENTVGIGIAHEMYKSDAVITTDENFTNSSAKIFYEHFLEYDDATSLTVTPEVMYTTYSNIDRNDVELILNIERDYDPHYLFADVMTCQSSDNYFTYHSVMAGAGINRELSKKLIADLSGSFRFKTFPNRTVSTGDYITRRRSTSTTSTSEIHNIIKIGPSITYKFTRHLGILLSYHYESLSSNNSDSEYSDSTIFASLKYSF